MGVERSDFYYLWKNVKNPWKFRVPFLFHFIYPTHLTGIVLTTSEFSNYYCISAGLISHEEQDI
jgi:hypothetical protein